jgi:hypothetical protein
VLLPFCKNSNNLDLLKGPFPARSIKTIVTLINHLPTLQVIKILFSNLCVNIAAEMQPPGRYIFIYKSIILSKQEAGPGLFKRNFSVVNTIKPARYFLETRLLSVNRIERQEEDGTMHYAVNPTHK